MNFRNLFLIPALLAVGALIAGGRVDHPIIPTRFTADPATIVATWESA